MNAPNASTRLNILDVVLLLLLIYAGCLPSHALAQAPDDRPFTVAAAANVDPNLFPIYVLENLYDGLPRADASATEQLAWITSTRDEAQRMLPYIRARPLDPSLTMLYRDCLSFVSAYETFLSELGRIRQQRGQETLPDAFGSLLEGLSRASDMRGTAKTLGANDDHASTAGTVAGVVSGMSDYYTRSQQHDAATATAIAAETSKLNGVWSAVRGDGEVITADLGRRYGWRRDEANFWDAASASAAKPRNPFSMVEAVIDLKGNESATVLMQGAVVGLQAADLVPADAVYDRYRSLFLYEAASLATTAASTEAGLRGYSAGPTPSSGYAVQFVRTYLAVNPGSDRGGAGHILLARALGESGRYWEAVAAANEAFNINPGNKQDMLTAYRYAKLLSLSGDTANSTAWLRQAYSLGFSAVDAIRQDPDLQNLRQARPALFQQLTSIQLTSPQFVWGWMMDDAWVNNKSAFPLTNLTVHVVVYKSGSTYQFNIKCASVKAGGACRNDNVISIPGDAYDSLQWTYTSDQGHS